MRRAIGLEAASELLERRDPLESLQGQPSLLEGIRAAYGAPLTPSQVVDLIVDDVRLRGDEAVAHHTRVVTGIMVPSLEVDSAEASAACDLIEPALLSALRTAADRIRAFHQACAPRTGIQFIDAELGRRVTPLDRVGLYVPGGRYSYPSSVLMSAIPAKVAGVREVIVATPPGAGGKVAPATLAACTVAGVDRIFAMGGAQAIAAMAYGTRTVPRVDKICGPGNVFVTLAKRKVFGSVAIDSLAGPSEVLIIADSTASVQYCAADMLAQAEHDPAAIVVLVTDSPALAECVESEVARQMHALGSQTALLEAMSHAVVAVVDSIADAVTLCNRFAPEHLEMLVASPRDHLEQIRNAGCICLGGDSPVVMGDYIDGPSHVLPTGGSARFSSVLSVEDFVKYSSIAQLSGATMSRLGPAAVTIARAEGLEAHARAVEQRLRDAV
ncbi:MAG: histidinol dehydrogenase [Dehalococcoidia bacterium]|nr:histidinol dehydrogenase [Dehalococcoidia bacterium]